VKAAVAVAQGKGVPGDGGSEGSRRQTSGPKNMNLIEGSRQLDESAKQDKVHAAEGCRE